MPYQVKTFKQGQQCNGVEKSRTIVILISKCRTFHKVLSKPYPLYRSKLLSNALVFKFSIVKLTSHKRHTRTFLLRPITGRGEERPPAKLLSAVLQNFANNRKLFVFFYTGSKDWRWRDGLFNLGRCVDSKMIN